MRRTLLLALLLVSVAAWALPGDDYPTGHTVNATALRNVPISTTAPTDGQLLGYSSSAQQWQPTAAPSSSLQSAYTASGSGNPVTILQDSTRRALEVQAYSTNTSSEIFAVKNRTGSVLLDVYPARVDVNTGYLEVPTGAFWAASNTGSASATTICLGSSFCTTGFWSDGTSLFGGTGGVQAFQINGSQAATFAGSVAINGAAGLSLTGIIGKYNNVSTAGLGVVPTYAAGGYIQSSGAGLQSTTVATFNPAISSAYEAHAACSTSNLGGDTVTVNVTYKDGVSGASITKAIISGVAITPSSPTVASPVAFQAQSGQAAAIVLSNSSSASTYCSGWIGQAL